MKANTKKLPGQSMGARVGADIGGTFTDVAMSIGEQLFSTKVLTNHEAPEQSVLDGIDIVCVTAGIKTSAISLVIHGTTLATNALIERRGAHTALVTTEGFRDVIEMRTENRFEQYDLNIVLPKPLISRQHRHPIAGRISAQGEELAPLDESALHELAETLREQQYESIAIGFIHSYVNAEHETRAREILAAVLPDASISISSEVSPQMREYERFNTVCANAYVRPKMESYLRRLQTRLIERGAGCPLYLIHSGGGLIDIETAINFPVRLVESGPAGGAMFAADYAMRFGLDKVISYDMGGTTAKICLIDNGQPKTARSFEVARSYRFKKGSGMPISIPVIEMVEIGAGGGSLASIDAMDRIQIGPESAGSTPGPACYQRDGKHPAVTDADLVLGKIDPDNFAGGDIPLSISEAKQAIERDVGKPIGQDVEMAAFGIVEMVDENMANAARAHAVESGKNVAETTMIAFGGAAPLHAARLCEKLSIDRCLIPVGAGVGSAIGFLRTPAAFELVQSAFMKLSSYDKEKINSVLSDLKNSIAGAIENMNSEKTTVRVVGFMRYAGQGWEIPVELSVGKNFAPDKTELIDAFEASYARHFGRPLSASETGGGELDIEIVSWSVTVSAEYFPPVPTELMLSGRVLDALSHRRVFDASAGELVDYVVCERDELKPGDSLCGPAIVVERETATVVSGGFDVVVQGGGELLLVRKLN